MHTISLLFRLEGNISAYKKGIFMQIAPGEQVRKDKKDSSGGVIFKLRRSTVAVNESLCMKNAGAMDFS